MSRNSSKRGGREDITVDKSGAAVSNAGHGDMFQEDGLWILGAAVGAVLGGAAGIVISAVQKGARARREYEKHEPTIEHWAEAVGSYDLLPVSEALVRLQSYADKDRVVYDEIAACCHRMADIHRRASQGKPTGAEMGEASDVMRRGIDHIYRLREIEFGHDFVPDDIPGDEAGNEANKNHREIIAAEKATFDRIGADVHRYLRATYDNVRKALNDTIFGPMPPLNAGRHYKTPAFGKVGETDHKQDA
ncbi:hypothetical protein [Mollivirus kamchatka]|nr:hypothetical protein [Mollivirus kamchatka]